MDIIGPNPYMHASSIALFITDRTATIPTTNNMQNPIMSVIFTLQTVGYPPLTFSDLLIDSPMMRCNLSM